jgi:GNAT superfamily N-acetyltransferase
MAIGDPARFGKFNFSFHSAPRIAAMKIRPLCLKTDLASVMGIINDFEPQPMGMEYLRGWLEYQSPERISLRLVALDELDALIGFCDVVHEVSMHANNFYAWVGIQKPHRQQGAGKALWDAASEFLHEQGAICLTSEVRDNDPISLGFAEWRGFRIDRHSFSSTLELTAFDERPYLPYMDNLGAQGIRFCSLADFPDTPENRYKLFELNAANVLDLPEANGVTWTFLEFEEMVLKAAWFRPEGQLLAVDGETWVGLAAVMLSPETRSAYNAHTGVRRAYRGKKIAQALKVFAARYARQNGTLNMTANNDSQNEAMLAINQKMGYVPQPGKYMLKRLR